jgi:hypothetical protein
VHNELGHSGWKSTWISVKNKYVFPKIRLAELVKEVVKHCGVCNVRTAKAVVVNEHHTVRTRPWEEVFVDVLNISSMVFCPNSLVVTVIDNYTKFLEVTVIANKSATEVCNALEMSLARYGTISVVRCDNGSEFDNVEMRALADKYKFTPHFGSVRNPQSQGVVEKVHSTLLGILRALCFGSEEPWTRFLQQALLCYRRRPHSSLAQLTPLEVLYGYPDGVLKEDFERDAFWAYCYDEVDTSADAAAVNTASPPVFSNGQPVLVRIDDRRKKKLDYPWQPATVVRHLGRTAYLLVDARGRHAVFNAKSIAPLRAAVPVMEPLRAAVPVMESPPTNATAAPSPAPVEDVPNPSTPEPLPEQPTESSPNRRSTRRHRIPRRLIEEIE